MSEPRISVVIPNYNHAHFLPRCLEAMLNQPVPPHEILVIDDASTDNSLEVLKSFADRSPLIKVHRNEKNMGVCRTMNRGTELAQGDYVLYPAADDEVLPGLFKQAAEMLRQHPEAGVCSGVCEWRDEATGLKWLSGGGMPDKPGYLSPDDMIGLAHGGRLTIAGQNAVYKKSALIEAGGWIPEFRWFTDWFGAYVIGFRYGMCHVPEVLSIFNVAPTQYSKSARSRERREVMEQMLQRLESERYADVTPRIVKSGLLGIFGWEIVRVVMARRTHWRFVNLTFLRLAAKRCAEVVGRRFFPNWLARFCLKVFYGRK